MDNQKAAEKICSYVLATIGVEVVVEDQAMCCQSLLDIAAVSRPTPRADWSDLLFDCARIQRRLAIQAWPELPEVLSSLALSMGLTLTLHEAYQVIQEGVERTRRDGAQAGFVAIAHRLCVLAVQ